MKQFREGDTYRLRRFDEVVNEFVGPGAFFIAQGYYEFKSGETITKFVSGGAGELTGSVTVTGRGMLFVAEPLGQVVRRQYERIEKPWGFELNVPTDAEQVLLKFIHVSEGHRTSLQSHDLKDEIQYGLTDTGALEVYTGTEMENGEVLVTTHAGIFTRLRPGARHRAVGPRDTIEASSFYPGDVVRHEDDYGR